MQGSVQLRVMCVDDEPDIIDLLQVVVEYEPDFVMVAATTSVSEIFDLVDRHRPDVVIIDQFVTVRPSSAEADGNGDGSVSTTQSLIADLRTVVPDATVAIFSGQEQPAHPPRDVGDVWVQKPDWAALWPAIREARAALPASLADPG